MPSLGHCRLLLGGGGGEMRCPGAPGSGAGARGRGDRSPVAAQYLAALGLAATALGLGGVHPPPRPSDPPSCSPRRVSFLGQPNRRQLATLPVVLFL